MKSFLIVLIFILSGCATLREKVVYRIHRGDSELHLVDTLGQPDSVDDIGYNAVRFTYTYGDDQCYVGVQFDKVTGYECHENPQVAITRQAAGAFLQGFGQAMQQQRIHTTSCYTSYGNTMCSTY